MTNVIVVDVREDFLADINTRMVLDDERNLSVLTTLTSAEHLHIALQRYKADIVAVCDNLIDTQEDWSYDNIAVVGYAATPEGALKISAKGLPSYGVVRQVSVLLDKLESGVPSVIKKETTAKTPEMPERASVTETAVAQQTAEPEIKNVDVSPANAPARNIRAQLSLSKEAARETASVEQDIHPFKKKTTVVTVYSAKGGVGKTSLATELAVYLALTSGGRSRYRVCLVDYNIDFGDVLTTLDFSSEGANMRQWAEEIRIRIKRGEAPDSIRYTQSEIEKHLQLMDKTGLYALLAPITLEESMDISEEELQVILRNIADCGGFDYVVCDTGNNARDATCIALEAAEYVLLVVTQDITAANCNDSFLTAMKKIRFDSDKIRLVINNVLPSKVTGVSVQEIEALFPYPCIARIRHDDDMIRANNYSQPIVYKPQHEVTKEIQKIIAFLTGVEDAQPGGKKSMLSQLFKK